MKRRKGDSFVVVGVREASGRPPEGYCGAGTETAVEWLRIRNGRVVDSSSVLIESCLTNREGRLTGWRSALFTFWTQGPDDGKSHYVFDAAHPRGIQKSDEPAHVAE